VEKARGVALSVSKSYVLGTVDHGLHRASRGHAQIMNHSRDECFG